MTELAPRVVRGVLKAAGRAQVLETGGTTTLSSILLQCRHSNITKNDAIVIILPVRIFIGVG